MIQVVLFCNRKYINEYKQFQDFELVDIIHYIEDAIKDKENTTIEITRWDDETRERK